MTGRSVDAIELDDGGCQLVVEAEGLAVVLELGATEAEHLARLLVDGGRPPLEVAS